MLPQLAANMGVCDRIFKKHGRWKSDSAKDGYVAENVHVQMSVTKNLIINRDCICFRSFFIFEVSCTRAGELFLNIGVLSFSL